MIAELLRSHFLFSHYTIHANVDGLGHADSLRVPSTGGNSMNWVLGHIVRGRRPALVLLGRETEEDEGRLAPYERGADLLQAEDAHDFTALLADFDRCQNEIHAGLDALEPSAYEEEVPGLFGGEGQRGVELSRLCFHEAYHGGQLGILRRTLGLVGVLS